MIKSFIRTHQLLSQNHSLFRTSYRSFGVVEDIQDKLKKQFNPSQIEVLDRNGDLYKVEVFIVSDSFKGMLPLQRHRAINKCIEEEVKKLHAITINAKTPDQVAQ